MRASIIAVSLAACVGPTEQGTIHFVMGATPDPATHTAGPPTPGAWLMSPSKFTVHLHFVDLSGDAGPEAVAGLSNCDAHYDRSLPGLAPIGDCAFEIGDGTFDHFRLVLANRDEDTMFDDVVIDDAGIYSDPTSPTRLTTTPPAGGAQPISVRVSEDEPTLWFDAPVTITPSFDLYVAIDGLQFFDAAVDAAGGAKVGEGDFTSIALPRFAASDAPFDHVGWYASAAMPTAASIHVGDTVPDRLSVYYRSPTEAQHVHSLVFDSPPSNCIATNTVDFTPSHGYVGVDATGTVAWAMPSYSGEPDFDAVMTLPQRTNLGDTTTLRCKSIHGDPRPAGGSFASGAPDTSMPDFELPMVLAAH